MDEARVYRNYHGEFINSRIVNGLRLADAVYASKLELPRHSHRHGGFCLVLPGGYTESYGKTSLECRPSSVKFQPAGEEHTDVYGGEAVRCFILELDTDWLSRVGASALVGNTPMVHKSGALAGLMTRLRAEFHSADAESPLLIEGLTTREPRHPDELGRNRRNARHRCPGSPSLENCSPCGIEEVVRRQRRQH